MPQPSEAAATQRDYSAWVIRAQRWGMAGLLAALLDAAAPLAPLFGQALYVAQPTLGLLLPRRSITDLAQWLDQPAGLIDLCRALEAADDQARNG